LIAPRLAVGLHSSSQLLRIHRSANGDVVFTISGRLDSENTAELEALIGAETGGRRIVLDLKNVTLAGQDGIDFLARCEEAGVTLVNCAAYVRDWIARQRGETGNR
jgi:anti-anti-sigma regulatory factor